MKLVMWNYSVWLIVLLAISPKPSFAFNQNQHNVNLSVLLENQVRVTNSVGQATRMLIARYPGHTIEVVDSALDMSPTFYKEIISAAVSTQPNFIDEILQLAIKKDLAPTATLLEIAIKAEPSYAEYAAEAACKFSPDEFMDLVKTAVKVEPDSADQIAKNLVVNYPNKTLDILIATIKEVPLVGKYVVDALLTLFPADSSESELMIMISLEQLAEHPEALRRLVLLANERGIDKEDVKMTAIKGGANNETISMLMSNIYKDDNEFQIQKNRQQ